MYANPDPELSKRVLYVALPNKREKAELIVQKAAEIGITELVFRSAQRSLLKELPEKKKERMETIVREATEQSW